ncbi:OLC1v1022039C1 [Oldenlandia corymbosa var. corymbosa]|uniref:non-specific serine/threonine protein kinase n=1 Tax=Oldenlandia corymbosa var. corymbosa TaxID=529605 RepID=A0AAV1BZ94_OLDCO|nr:OLC1v1022039C1 [Oldenlandia corymbosa var. corymbosa]
MKAVSSKNSLVAFLLIICWCSSVQLLCFFSIPTAAQSTNGTLPQAEIDALKAIADELGKHDWDFNLNPCDGNANWSSPKRDQYNNTLHCNCTFPDGVCHVEKLFLKGQDLQGVLPPSLAKLPYLKTIDLTRNYLSGTIPPEWASMNLEYLSVIVNRLSGPIPAYLGNITTLVYVSLESNMFNGTIPDELGKLENLANLILSANNLTGDLPTALNNLTKLQELRLSSNNFTGSLPNFQNWTNLQYLELEATGFQGPIPSSISALQSLTELRISDLNGSAAEFPQLRGMTNMSSLVLRNCNISGNIPGDLANMPNLKNLDLSFNKLEGGIPDLSGVPNLETMYLTGNALTGPIPDWIKSSDAKHQIDLSYNNFSPDSEPSTCRETLNLYRSCDDGKPFAQAKCLQPCSKDYYSLHINCGGDKTTAGNRIFDADLDPGGPAKFVPNYIESWGTSNTGDFWGVNSSVYTAQNVSVITANDSGLYASARRSPLSLTYYGRCLANGNYTVTLHFAEIILRDTRSYQSLGRRIFDVYIQGERILKDFDIEEEAQGVDKPVQKEYRGVLVDNGILEIRLAYAGKGSTAVPRRGTYGPLISAISVQSEFPPPSKGKKKIFIAVGTSVAALVTILAVLGIMWRRQYARNHISREEELKGLDLRTGIFTYRQIQAATENFSAENKIGEGGFGAVYKGTLLDGTIIAVKQLSQKSKQGNREFVNEVGIISGLLHPNVVRLYGCCIEGNQLFLVYEYMENNNLARALFGPEELQLEMDWPTRQRICVGISKGLAFLHDESTLKIVHRDIKTNNILLDKELNPKISDFGLAKLDEEENTHISTRVAGTIGYMAPEYALWGYLTFKADVYSFGIVALEIVAGKSNMAYRPSEDYVCLLDWALVLQTKGSLLELVDPRLGSNFNEEKALRMIKVALMCTNPSPALRPTMSSVVSLLEGRSRDDDLTSDPSIYHDGLKLQGLRDKYSELQQSTSSHSVSNPSEKDTTSLSSTRS